MTVLWQRHQRAKNVPVAVAFGEVPYCLIKGTSDSGDWSKIAKGIRPNGVSIPLKSGNQGARDVVNRQHHTATAGGF
jgi:hypothetical protein